jgi:4-hydroxy-tetrahydrodipicolinate reductase
MSEQDFIRVGIAGAAGRMGRAVRLEIADHPRLRLAALIGRPAHEGEKLDGEILATAAQGLGRCDVVIDFTSAEASAHLARLAADNGGPALVIGSTGFSSTQEGAVQAASHRIAIAKAGNFSLGVAILTSLVEQTSRRLAADMWDIEIFDAHHRRKRDAPSGTARALGDAAARGRGVGPTLVPKLARAGLNAERRRGDIGFSVMRAGEIVGEHSVLFAADGEVLTLSHSARDRRIFAKGALEAALWLVSRPPGLYGMSDVLGLAS